MMTDTEVSMRVLGSAWPGHFNKTVAETMHANIEKVGLPKWTRGRSDAGQGAAARAEGAGDRPRDQDPAAARPRSRFPTRKSAAAAPDDIGDISWNVPTVTLNYPSNIQAGPGHNWANAISMATPIAHKGIQYGAKVVALTVHRSADAARSSSTQAWDYFNNVQTKDKKYVPLIRPEDKPAIWLNKERMEKLPAGDEEATTTTRPSTRTISEQLGIKYPTTEKPAKPSAR